MTSPFTPLLDALSPPPPGACGAKPGRVQAAILALICQLIQRLEQLFAAWAAGTLTPPAIPAPPARPPAAPRPRSPGQSAPRRTRGASRRRAPVLAPVRPARTPIATRRLIRSTDGRPQPRPSRARPHTPLRKNGPPAAPHSHTLNVTIS